MLCAAGVEVQTPYNAIHSPRVSMHLIAYQKKKPQMQFLLASIVTRLCWPINAYHCEQYDRYLHRGYVLECRLYGLLHMLPQLPCWVFVAAAAGGISDWWPGPAHLWVWAPSLTPKITHLPTYLMQHALINLIYYLFYRFRKAFTPEERAWSCETSSGTTPHACKFLWCLYIGIYCFTMYVDCFMFTLYAYFIGL